MKKKSILLSIALASSLVQAEEIKSISFINLTKISPTIAQETLDFQAGDELDINKVNNAIKKFYKFDYFKDITVSNNNGKLEFIFKEKPSIANVDITGYKQRDEDIEELKNKIHLKKGQMYSPKSVKKAKELLLKELEKEGYINSVIEVDIDNLSNDSVAVTFNVNKGDEIIIKKINYFGAKNLDDGDLEHVIANKEEEFASWFITQNDGELKADQLKYDNRRIQELYFENGYLDAEVDNPFVSVDFASNQADLDFYINEGRQYEVKSIKIFLNSKILDPKELYPELKLRKDRVFNIKKLRRDADYIKTKVADLGYAFAQVKYDIKKDKEKGTAQLIYNVIPGEKVYIRDVKISGNTRTLDRVVRRNVYLAPGDLFNLTDFKDSKNKLKRTGFFESVDIEQRRVTATQMDLIVKVKETTTGSVMVGGGYGSSDGFIIAASLNEKNIFGSGLALKISTDTSDSSKDTSIVLTNPAIRDSKYSGYIDIHDKKDEYERDKYDLDKKTMGFTVGLGREVIRNLYAGARYRLDFIKEEYDYESGMTFDSSKKYYKDTDYVTSSIIPYLKFNNTNDYYFPTDGFKAGTSLEYAGLGGDSKYIKSSSYFKYYYSLEDDFDLDWVFRYKARADFIVDNGQLNQGDSLYLGGVKTLRGFSSAAFGPDNDDGTIEDPYKAMAATSFELSFPLITSSKMRWGVFYDYGMIGENNISDVTRSSTGALFEWVSPFGPLQLIFAQPLDDKPGDDTSTFEFSMGQSF